MAAFSFGFWLLAALPKNVIAGEDPQSPSTMLVVASSQ